MKRAFFARWKAFGKFVALDFLNVLSIIAKTAQSGITRCSMAARKFVP
jgi:hypothetical protein